MNTLAKASALRLKKTRQVREHDMLDAVLKLIPDAVISVDLAGHIKTFNPAAERIFGRSSASVQGGPVDLLIPARFSTDHQAAMQRFARLDGEARMMGLRRVKGLRADGQEIELEGIISHVNLPQGERLLVTLHDVTMRVQAEAQLQHSRAQLAELTRKLMTQERVLVKRLAQVLHDQLGQTLAAIRMCHETLVDLQTAQTPPDWQHLQERMGTLIGQAIAQVRQVLQDLRPPLLEEQGLSVALDNELRNRALGAPRMDISINVPPKLELMRWPAEVEYAAFMVVREAVENALRHSGASAIAVDLSGNALKLHLSVIDNGVGLPEGVGLGGGHLGLLGMRERAQAVGASVSYGRAQEAGTHVAFHWQCAS
jgi:PAS domain S-box-containing protein